MLISAIIIKNSTGPNTAPCGSPLSIGESALIPPGTTIAVYEDNQGAIALIENPVHHQRTKHIDIRYHLIREQVIIYCTYVEYLQTDLMVADCLTKPVGRIKLEYCIGTLFCMKHE